MDAEFFQTGSVEALQEWLDEDRPPIVALSEPGEWYHAVVVCEITAHAVTVMDPMAGSYEVLSREDFLYMWLPMAGSTLIVGGTGRRPPGGSD